MRPTPEDYKTSMPGFITSGGATKPDDAQLVKPKRIKDSVSPQLLSATVDQGGQVIVFLFSEPVMCPTGAVAGFTFFDEIEPGDLTYAGGNGLVTINVDTAGTILENQTGVVNYDGAVGKIRDLNGNPVASKAGILIDNNSEQN